jgi:hypothetical protein
MSTRDRVESAMCMWEAVLEELADPKEIEESVPNKWRKLCEQIGTCALRSHVADLSNFCDWSWQILNKEGLFDGCYDWDYCPAFLDHACDEKCELRSDALKRMRSWARKELGHERQGQIA